jgi:hypothetical protein
MAPTFCEYLRFTFLDVLHFLVPWDLDVLKKISTWDFSNVFFVEIDYLHKNGLCSKFYIKETRKKNKEMFPQPIKAIRCKLKKVAHFHNFGVKFWDFLTLFSLFSKESFIVHIFLILRILQR